MECVKFFIWLFCNFIKKNICEKIRFSTYSPKALWFSYKYLELTQYLKTCWKWNNNNNHYLDFVLLNIIPANVSSSRLPQSYKYSIEIKLPQWESLETEDGTSTGINLIYTKSQYRILFPFRSYFTDIIYYWIKICLVKVILLSAYTRLNYNYKSW